MYTTVTLNLPEEIATRLMQLPAQERDHVAGQALHNALDEEEENRHRMSDDPDDDFPPGTTLADYFGIGAGRPGAIGNDVEGYISQMRDEWEEREKQWR